MSADNQLIIKDNTVYHVSSEGIIVGVIGKGKTLRQAIKIAKEWEEENYLEYGITFIN